MLVAALELVLTCAAVAAQYSERGRCVPVVEVARRRLRRAEVLAVLRLEQEVLAVHREPRLAAGSSVTTRGQVELVVRSSSVLSPVVGSSAMTREQRLLAAGRKLDRLPAAMACSVRGDWKPTRSATTPS